MTGKYTHADLLRKEGGDQWFQSSDYSISFSLSFPARPTLQCCSSQEFSLALEQQNAATLCGSSSCDNFCLHSYKDWGPHAFCSLLFSVEHLYLTFTYLLPLCLLTAAVSAECATLIIGE